MSKTTTLNAEQWKALCLLNLVQLHSFLQQVPGNLEGGTPGMNAERIGAIGNHLDELGRFMGAWSKARAGDAVQPEAKTIEANAENSVEAEVVQPPKRGWPKGKPRKPREAAAEH